MNRSVHRSGQLYVAAFYVFLFAPLVVVAVFAFNASPFPAPPWRGFTLDWFVGTGAVFGSPACCTDPDLAHEHRQQPQGRAAGHAAGGRSSARRTRSCSSGREFRGKTLSP